MFAPNNVVAGCGKDELALASNAGISLAGELPATLGISTPQAWAIEFLKSFNNDM